MTFLSLLFLAVAGLDPALGQNGDWLEGDVPQWVEDLGYEHAHENGTVSGEATEGLEVDSGSDASGVATRSDPECSCLFCRDRLTGDWCGCRSRLQQNGIVYRGRVTQFFFGVEGGVVRPVPPPYAAMGIAGGDTFEYTGNSDHPCFRQGRVGS
jgi:hypothetical protein